VLQIQTVWPFPDREVAELGRRVRRIVVPEMNYAGQIAGEVRKTVAPEMDLRQVNRYNGTIISPQDILAAVLDPSNG
jgi:2-oxoglutarate ferredoxin oxidoreductase subunit alpha